MESLQDVPSAGNGVPASKAQHTEALTNLLENHSAQRIARLNAALDAAPEESKGLIQSAIANANRNLSQATKNVNASRASAPGQQDKDETPGNSWCGDSDSGPIHCDGVREDVTCRRV